MQEEDNDNYLITYENIYKISDNSYIIYILFAILLIIYLLFIHM
jgi:hypothetical protein